MIRSKLGFFLLVFAASLVLELQLESLYLVDAIGIWYTCFVAIFYAITAYIVLSLFATLREESEKIITWNKTLPVRAMNEIAQLEAHLLRIKATVEGWTDVERAARCEGVISRLLESGVAIDDEITAAIEKFKSGAIGFDEFSMSFQGKV